MTPQTPGQPQVFRGASRNGNLSALNQPTSEAVPIEEDYLMNDGGRFGGGSHSGINKQR